MSSDHHTDIDSRSSFVVQDVDVIDFFSGKDRVSQTATSLLIDTPVYSTSPLCRVIVHKAKSIHKRTFTSAVFGELREHLPPLRPAVGIISKTSQYLTCEPWGREQCCAGHWLATRHQWPCQMSTNHGDLVIAFGEPRSHDYQCW